MKINVYRALLWGVVLALLLGSGTAGFAANKLGPMVGKSSVTDPKDPVAVAVPAPGNSNSDPADVVPAQPIHSGIGVKTPDAKPTSQPPSDPPFATQQPKPLPIMGTMGPAQHGHCQGHYSSNAHNDTVIGDGCQS